MFLAAALLLVAASTSASPQATTVEICVVDTSGRAIAGAVIDPGYAPVPSEHEPADERQHRREVLLGERIEPSVLPASGCAVLHLPRGLLRVSVTARRHFATSMQLDTEKETRLQVELQPFEAREQTIRVVDRKTLKAVEGVRVVATWRGSPGGFPVVELLTNAAGEVTFGELPAGPYDVEVAGRRRIEYHVEQATLGVAPESVVIEVQANPRVLVVGRVVDSEGRPVANARIRGARNRPRTRTDENGKFEARAWATPTAYLVARKEGLGNASASIRSDEVREGVVDVGVLELRHQPLHGVIVTRTVLEQRSPPPEKPHDRDP